MARRAGRPRARGGARPARGDARAAAPPASVTAVSHACLPVTQTTKPGPTLRRARAPRFRGHSMRRRHPVHHAGRVGTLSGGRSSGSRIVLRPRLPASELAVASRSLRPRSQRRVRAGLAPASLKWPSRAPPSAADASPSAGAVKRGSADSRRSPIRADPDGASAGEGLRGGTPSLPAEPDAILRPWRTTAR